MKLLNHINFPIMVISDRPEVCGEFRGHCDSLSLNNIIECCPSSKMHLYFKKQNVPVVFIDNQNKILSSKEAVPLIKKNYPQSLVIIITETDLLAKAKECLKLGAFELLFYPFDLKLLSEKLSFLFEYWNIKNENLKLKENYINDELVHPENFAEIQTQNSKLIKVLKYIEIISPTFYPILITGESGVGKELIAHSVHQSSGAKGKFVAVNISGYDDHLFSDDLFGHKKGSFTGAIKDRKGLIESASDGTIFLDEIGDLSLQSQVKLLRLIQENEYYPIGADKPQKSNARIVAATNKNLKELIKKNQFREDLFFRLNTYHLNIPPLRERKEDIPILIRKITTQTSKHIKDDNSKIPQSFIDLLSQYHFPGNIRELQNIIIQFFSNQMLGESKIDELKKYLKMNDYKTSGQTNDNPQSAHKVIFPDILPQLRSIEDMLIDEALERTHGNITQAAKLLGLSRIALQKRISRRNKN